MTLRLWLACLCLGAGLALSGPSAAYAQVTDHQLSDQNDPANPLRPLQFQTQVGLRIAPPARSGGAWRWYRVRFNDAGTAPLWDGLQSPAFTRTFTPAAADLGAYLAVCWQASDATDWHCTPWTGPVKPAIPVSFPTADRSRRLKWSAGSSLASEGHDPLAVHDEIQIRGGGGRQSSVKNQPFGAWWQRSTGTQIPAQPDAIETFLYLRQPEQWANPDILALPAEPGEGDNRRYLTPDDVGRYVRGCFWRTWGDGDDTTPHWACTTWRGPVVATVHLPDEYRMEIVGVPSHVDVRGAAPVTWWRRRGDVQLPPTQVAADANPYTPVAADAGHFLRACHAVGDDRACTRWLGPVLPALPALGGVQSRIPNLGYPIMVYAGVPLTSSEAIQHPGDDRFYVRVGDRYAAGHCCNFPDAPNNANFNHLYPVPLAPNGHDSQLTWMVIAGDGTSQNPSHNRVVHIGPEYTVPQQYEGWALRTCLYGTDGGNVRGWTCTSFYVVQARNFRRSGH